MLVRVPYSNAEAVRRRKEYLRSKMPLILRQLSDFEWRSLSYIAKLIAASPDVAAEALIEMAVEGQIVSTTVNERVFYSIAQPGLDLFNKQKLFGQNRDLEPLDEDKASGHPGTVFPPDPPAARKLEPPPAVPKRGRPRPRKVVVG